MNIWWKYLGSYIFDLPMHRLLPILLIVALTARSFAEEENYIRTENVIYGQKAGISLTLDVFKPQNPNRAAVVHLVSGAWFSSREFIDLNLFRSYLDRGYTVFTVVHGSQPKFAIPEIVDDIHRSIRFVRARADQFQIDPDRIGIAGASAGGHLALLIGTSGTVGKPDAKDPVDRVSSRVRAVACFFPPTDFLNYGRLGNVDLGNGELKPFQAAFDFTSLDPASGRLLLITDQKKRLEIGREISPASHATADDPPTFIIHGRRDVLVPFQQSELFIQKLRELNIPCELVPRDEGHGWTGFWNETPLLADWFDRHLLPK